MSEAYSEKAMEEAARLTAEAARQAETLLNAAIATAPDLMTLVCVATRIPGPTAGDFAMANAMASSGVPKILIRAACSAINSYAEALVKEGASREAVAELATRALGDLVRPALLAPGGN